MSSVDGADFQHIGCAVAAMAREFHHGDVSPRHSHQQAQFLYAISGVMNVVTDEGTWIVPPHRACWLPSGIEHEVHFRGKSSLRTLYIDKDALPRLPMTCQVVNVSALLSELIIAAISMPIGDDFGGRGDLVMALILEEIALMKCVPLHVKNARSQRLANICDRVRQEPGAKLGIDQWAKAAHMSRRTFTRTFLAETGESFTSWRRNVRLMEAIVRLATNQSITTVAMDVGFESASAFAASFRKRFDVAPSVFLGRRASSSQSEDPKCNTSPG